MPAGWEKRDVICWRMLWRQMFRSESMSGTPPECHLTQPPLCKVIRLANVLPTYDVKHLTCPKYTVLPKSLSSYSKLSLMVATGEPRIDRTKMQKCVCSLDAARIWLGLLSFVYNHSYDSGFEPSLKQLSHLSSLCVTNHSYRPGNKGATQSNKFLASAWACIIGVNRLTASQGSEHLHDSQCQACKPSPFTSRSTLFWLCLVRSISKVFLANQHPSLWFFPHYTPNHWDP